MADEFDPFSLEDAENGYSLDKFYVRSTDGKGNSETKYLKASPSQLGAIGQLIASRVIPAYRTDGDFIRDAIVHRLRYIAQMIKDGKLESVATTATWLAEMKTFQAELADLNALVDQYGEVMQMCVELRDLDTLRASIESAERALEDVKPAYRKRLVDLVDKFKAELTRLRKGS